MAVKVVNKCTIFCPMTMEFRDVIEEANNCLLFRRFDECLQICQQNIEAAKNYVEDDRARYAIEALVAVAIQAYAELNRWLEVVPFVAQIYNGLEECPPLIAQLCLLLHAKLKDDVTCTVIAGIWLKNPTNFSLPEYRNLVEVYIVHVLLPAQRWDDVRPFLDACPGLDETHRQSCLRQVRVYRQRCEEKAADEIEVIESSARDETKIAEDRPPNVVVYKWLPLWMSPFYYPARRWVQKTAPLVPVQIIRNICCVLVCLYFLISRWRQGRLLKSEALLRLWTMLGSLWRRMFGPFYMISN